MRVDWLQKPWCLCHVAGVPEPYGAMAATRLDSTSNSVPSSWTDAAFTPILNIMMHMVDFIKLMVFVIVSMATVVAIMCTRSSRTKMFGLPSRASFIKMMTKNDNGLISVYNVQHTVHNTIHYAGVATSLMLVVKHIHSFCSYNPLATYYWRTSAVVFWSSLDPLIPKHPTHHTCMPMRKASTTTKLWC